MTVVKDGGVLVAVNPFVIGVCRVKFISILQAWNLRLNLPTHLLLQRQWCIWKSIKCIGTGLSRGEGPTG